MIRLKKQHTYFLLGLVAALFVVGVVSLATPVLADTFGVQELDENLPLGNQDIRITIGKIIRAALGLLGVVALGIVLYGGYLYMTAGGNEEQITSAKKTIINGVIGMAITLSAFTITQFVLSRLIEATGSNPNGGGCVGTFEECNNDPEFGSCTDRYFVSKSITPSQNETDMNNIVIRAIFSKAVGTQPNEVLRIERDGQNITDAFDFKFVPGTGKKILEAIYKVEGNCAEENKKEDENCLELNDNEYKVTLRENIVSEAGETINADEDCEAFEPVTEATFKVAQQQNDVVPPSIGQIQFITEEGVLPAAGARLVAGTTYPIRSLITDDKGVGAVSARVERENGNSLLTVVDGPQKGETAEPFQFQHNLIIPANAQPRTPYRATIYAFDIDHNIQQQSVTFFVVPQHCENDELDADKGETDVDAGGDCGCAEGDTACQCSDTVACAAGLACVEGACVSQPEITEISPQDGSAGNWISIIGRGFGANTGKIEFGLDENNDGEWDETDEWVSANVIQCDVVSDSWTNNYAVVEVPSSTVLGQFSAIRITRASDGRSDISTDSYGVRPMPKNPALLEEFEDNNYPAGVFVKKANLDRPGLCAVVNSSNRPEGYPGVEIVAQGKSFGATQGSSFLNFGGLAAPINAWGDSAIAAVVPGNVNPGRIGVHVEVGAEQSNKVLFKILDDDDENAVPVVTEVSPTSTTKGSFITIVGRNFGNETGFVHLAPNENANCPVDGCKLLDFDLPTACGDIWSTTQIIGKIPDDADIATYHIIVERAAGLKSKATHNVSILDGATLPGICKLKPTAGPAPLPPENTAGLEITGINFSSDPTIYFWKAGAVVDNLNTWLSSKKDNFPVGQGVVNVDKEFINTFIPYSEADGLSMQSGFIKIKADNGALSNGIRYEVSDCRAALNPLAGYACCSEGPGAGQWVKDGNMCPGETVSSGYVWRFTTGLIPNMPRVIEQCDVEGWYGSGSQMPSPVPSTLWPSGRNACTNANIEIATTVGLDKSSILGPDNQPNTSDDRIKVYTCGTGDEPSCNYTNTDTLIDNLSIGGYDESNILTIWKSVQGNLDANTWYRVVLSKEIDSVPLDAGNGATEVKPLLATKPLADLPDAAYHFDFKTSDKTCVLERAFIVPPSKTTHVLGLLKNPWNINEPFYYYLKGKANQECILLPIDGKGWEWSTNPESKADVDPAPLIDAQNNFVFEDTRAKVEALADAPEGVRINATLPNVAQGFTSSFNSTLPAEGVLIATTPKMYPATSMFGFELHQTEKFSIEYKGKIVGGNLNADNTLVYLPDQFAIETRADKSICLVAPPDNSTPALPSQIEVCTDPTKDPVVANGEYHFVWTWDGSTLKMFNKSGLIDSVSVSHFSGGRLPSGINRVYIGGRPGTFPLINQTIRFGGISSALTDAQAVSHLNGGQTSYFADESILYIDLFDPEVIYFEPNCSESCINADIRVDFNRQMAEETYASGFRVFKCTDGPTCNTPAPVSIYAVDDSSTPTTLRATISGTNKLQPNTWYKVSLNGNNLGIDLTNRIVSLGQLEPPIHGKPLPKTEWIFRTKNDGTPCEVNRLQITPDPFTLYFVGHKAPYSVIPYSTPNACSANGQALNKWDYSYQWDTKNHDVATISTFNTSFGWQSSCTSLCLRAGSTIGRTASGTAQIPALCGNGIIDVGEDCEITDTVNGQTNVDKNVCTLSCLYTPDRMAAFLLTGSDPLPTGNLGQVQGKSYCGDGIVTQGETCDIGIPNTQGCTNRCLRAGTQISTHWCQTSANSAQKAGPECVRSVSVCGNGKIESNEECEVGATLGGVTITAEMCSSQCLLQNICSYSSIPGWCNADEEWCNDDCTLGGSSLFNVPATLCGDGVVNDGEDAVCEITDPSAKKYDGQGAVQIATAVGKAQTDANGLQSTEVETKLYTNPLIVDTSDLSLQCGFVEYKQPKIVTVGEEDVPVFNNCVQNDNNEMGVASNSCCMLRPTRVGEYPKANTGLTNDSEPACRNSYISVSFNREMLITSLLTDTPNIANPSATTLEELQKMSAASSTAQINAINEKLKNALNANMMLVVGYKDAAYKCVENNGIDVTNEIKEMLNSPDGQAQAPGFWAFVWEKIKSFFALIVDTVFAADDAPEATTVEEAKVWCAAQIPIDAEVTFDIPADADAQNSTATSTVSLFIKKLMRPNAVHGVFVRGGETGVRDVFGVGIKSPSYKGRSDIWFFRTGEQTCKIDSLSANPNSYLFNKPNASQKFLGMALSNNGQFIVSIPDVYAWRWNWKPENQVFTIPDIDAPSNIISSRNVEGHINAVLQATVTADVAGDNNHLGKKFTAPIDLTAMFCERPWPAYVGSSWGPWENNTYNFSFSYCADAGKAGDSADDLPYLKAPLNIELQDQADVLQKQLFLNDKNADGIGFQIFKNDKNDGEGASIEEWYIDHFETLGNMQKATVAGYEALTDGFNYYINALNFLPEDGVDYPNVYLFSVNPDASESTKQALEQILASLEFNTNLSDHNLCLVANVPKGVDGLRDTPDLVSNVACTTDFQCVDATGNPKEGTNGVCSNVKTKFFRDWQRLHEIEATQNKLDAYFVNTKGQASFKADFNAGSFVPGYTNSRWTLSWSELSGLIDGATLDPVNQWSACGSATSTDQQTCWNANDAVYNCPLVSQVYEYEYKKDTDSYVFHAPLEFIKVTDEVADDYIDFSTYSQTPWCVGKGLGYSPSDEQCGNGVLGPNEVCDPPGKVMLSQQGKKADGTVGQCEVDEISSNICNATCTGIDYGSCSAVSTCKNGIVEAGEACDDGALNGSYGHCSQTCDGLSESYCGDGEFDAVNEYCDWSAPNWNSGASKYYNVNQANSCSWDCKAPGTFCGDGIVQSAEGEQCDDQNTNNNDACSNTCKLTARACVDAALNMEIDENIGTTNVTTTNITIGESSLLEECKIFTQPQICSALGLGCASFKLENINGSTSGAFGGSDCTGPQDARKLQTLAGYYSSYSSAVVECLGVAAEAVSAPQTGGFTKNQCGNGVVETYQNANGENVVEVCDTSDKNGIQCTPEYGKSCTYCAQDCKTVLTKDTLAYCGNGIVDVVKIDAQGNEVYEACDNGSQVDGDIAIRETRNGGQSWQDVGLSCSETFDPENAGARGTVMCSNNCTEVDQTQCAACTVTTGNNVVIPKIALVNPLVANGVQWPQSVQDQDYVAMYRIDLDNPFLGFNKLNYEVKYDNGSVAPLMYRNPQTLHHMFVDAQYKPIIDKGIDTSTLCANDYSIYFNYRNLVSEKQSVIGHGWEGDDYLKTDIEVQNFTKFGDLFPYPVAPGGKEVVNEYIVSPAMPINHFRVVVSWTDEEVDKGYDFAGTVYTPYQGGTGASQQIGFTSTYYGTHCNTMSKVNGRIGTVVDQYWYPKGSGNFACTKFHKNIFVHEKASAIKTYVQAFTIDTDESTYDAGSQTYTWDEVVPNEGAYAFMVQSINNAPIAQLTNTKLKVEVYGYHPHQDGLYSVYRPVKTFYIKNAAGTSTNEFAGYWHVFNLENKNGAFYEIVPVESIETNFCQVKSNVPGAPQC